MDRLTCRDSDGNAHCRYASSFYEIVDSLEHYEDLEEKMEQILSVHQTMKDFVCACVEYYELSKTKPEIADAMLISNADAKKLKEYKDLEEQGLLLKLPCKVGDKFYRVAITCSDGGHEEKGDYFPFISDCMYHCNEECDKELVVIEETFRSVEEIVNKQRHLGELYFLTKSEAEKALAKMEK